MENPGDTDRCPRCGSDDLRRDEVHNGVAMLYGLWGCVCGWSEDARYDQATAPRGVDQYGGFTPTSPQGGAEAPGSED
jgi:hypothetical protein